MISWEHKIPWLASSTYSQYLWNKNWHSTFQLWVGKTNTAAAFTSYSYGNITDSVRVVVGRSMQFWNEWRMQCENTPESKEVPQLSKLTFPLLDFEVGFWSRLRVKKSECETYVLCMLWNRAKPHRNEMRWVNTIPKMAYFALTELAPGTLWERWHENVAYSHYSIEAV